VGRGGGGEKNPNIWAWCKDKTLNKILRGGHTVKSKVVKVADNTAEEGKEGGKNLK